MNQDFSGTPEFLAEIAQIIEWYVEENGQVEKSEKMAEQVTTDVRTKWGGLVIYVAGSRRSGGELKSQQRLFEDVDKLPDTGKQNEKSAKFLSDLGGYVDKAAESCGIEKDTANLIVIDIVEGFVQRWGGLTIYIPSCSNIERESRDEQIFSEYTGANHMALAKKYGLAMQTVYLIIRQQRQKLRDKNQIKLF